MSSGRHEVNLCGKILEDHFGETVARVGLTVLKEKLTLPALTMTLQKQWPPDKKVTMKRIRRSLCILDHHNLLLVGIDSAFRTTYQLSPTAAQEMLAFPRCCFVAKTLYGTVAEAVCEEIASQGRLSCSDVMRRVRLRLGVPVTEIKKKFAFLSESQFVERLPPIESKCRGTPVPAVHWERFTLPDEIAILPDATEGEIATQAAVNMEEDIKPSLAALQALRKRKAPSGELTNGDVPDPDRAMLWKLNVPRFRRYFRDQIVLEQVCGTTEITPEMEQTELNMQYAMRALLKVAEMRVPSPEATCTPPITLMDILRAAKEAELPIEKRDMEWAFTQIVDESNGVVRKVGDSGGGLYVIDFEKGIAFSVDKHVDSMLREQVDSKAVRIRRFLMARGYAEEDSIDKAVMLSSKQTRDLLYSMLEENYVCVKSIGRTNDFAPARTLWLYHVDQAKTVRTLVETTCQMLHNLIVRRLHLEIESRPLIEKQVKMDTIIANIDADATMDEQTKKDQKQEVEEIYMSGTVKKDLETSKMQLAKLHYSEIEVEKVLYTFKAFLHFGMKRPRT